MSGGRPTKLTPEVQAAVIEAISRGNYRQTAASLAGIHRHTLQNWERWGEEGKEPYAEFLAAMQSAEAQAESDLLDEIQRARPGVTGSHGADLWQAKAWIMERRWPQRWAARVRTVVAEEVASLTASVRKSLDPETYSKVVDAVSKEPGESPGDAHH